MAAIVASLAAVVTGCGLPNFPGLGVNSLPQDLEKRDLSGSTDCSCSGAWTPESQRDGLDEADRVRAIASLTAWKPRSKGAKDFTEPGSSASEVVQIDLLRKLPASVHGSALKRKRCPRWLPRWCARRRSSTPRVTFDLVNVTKHEVTPYSEVYGVHPRSFNFAHGEQPPVAVGWFADPRQQIDDGDESSDAEDTHLWIAKRRAIASQNARRKNRTLAARRVPTHAWMLVAVLTFIVRAFGVHALFEMLQETSGAKTLLMS